MTVSNSYAVKNMIRSLSIIFLSLLLFACQGEEEIPVYTIGIVNLTPSLDPVADGFMERMEELGYVEGENITYIYDGPTNSIDELDGVIEGLLEEDVDLLLALSTPAAIAAKTLTDGSDMRVIFVPVNDPVAAGLVESLPHPNGNLTGIKAGGFLPKELAWLLTLDPTIETIYSPYNPNDQSSSLGHSVLEQEAEHVGITLIAPEVNSPEETIIALNVMPDEVDAILLLTDAMILSQATSFVEVAMERSLPLASINQKQVEDGVLMGYGPEFFPMGRQAARLADQILKGMDPSDLPVETGEFFFTINTDTAEKIGLDIPTDILQQANEIVR